MGTICCKKEEYFKDVPEKKNYELNNIQKLVMYNNITKEETINIKRIHKCKRINGYTNLVFEGGGMKGVAYCGALEILESMNILKNIKNFGGSSVGGFFAALIAIGYNAKELTKLAYSTDFSTFINNDNIFNSLEKAINLTIEMGMSDGYKFERFIEDCIIKKTGNKNYRFIDLYKDKMINLVLTGTDINRELTVYFGKDSHPHMPIKEALRITMGIPILFKPFEHNKDLFVDGGMLDNYPIHMFDGSYPGDLQAKENLSPVNPRTLGLKLVENNDKSVSIVKHQKITGVKGYLFRLVDTMYTSNNRRYMRPSFWERTIPIQVPNIPITDFSVSSLEKDIMIVNGREAVNIFFNN
jgi:NTE family protein